MPKPAHAHVAHRRKSRMRVDRVNAIERREHVAPRESDEGRALGEESGDIVVGFPARGASSPCGASSIIRGRCEKNAVVPRSIS